MTMATNRINLAPIALSTLGETAISYSIYALLFPSLRRAALNAEGKPNLAAATNVTTGATPYTHEQTMTEAVASKYAPSMVLTFLKNYIFAATLKTLGIRDPVDAGTFGATLWLLKEMPVLADEFMWEQRPLALPGIKAVESLARSVFTAWFLAFWPAY